VQPRPLHPTLPIYKTVNRTIPPSKRIPSSTFNMLIPHLAPVLMLNTTPTPAYPIHLPTPGMPAYTSPSPSTSTNLKDCSASFGIPGAVYLCPLPNFKPSDWCTWHAPSCVAFDDLTWYPRSIGPDPGGFCELFATSDCTGETVAYVNNESKSYINKNV
jgi:hypothetical protein